MSRTVTFLAVAAAPLLAAAAAAPAPSADLDQVRAYLRGVTTMTADFTQTDRNGRTVSGTIQIARPGKVRFQYEKGVPLLVVGDGKALTMIDYQVRQVSRWPIGNTPLALLLDPDRDVGRLLRTLPSTSPDELLIEGQDPKHREYGTITIAFRRDPSSPAGLMLEGWTVLDSQNNRTTVRLANPHYNVPVPASAFRWVDPRPQGRK